MKKVDENIPMKAYEVATIDLMMEDIEITIFMLPNGLFILEQVHYEKEKEKMVLQASQEQLMDFLRKKQLWKIADWFTNTVRNYRYAILKRLYLQYPESYLKDKKAREYYRLRKAYFGV